MELALGIACGIDASMHLYICGLVAALLRSCSLAHYRRGFSLSTPGNTYTSGGKQTRP